MTAESFFGLVVRLTGLGLVLYGFYHSFGSFWRFFYHIAIHKYPSAVFNTGSFFGALLFLFAGVVMIRKAPKIVRCTYPSEEDQSDKPPSQKETGESKVMPEKDLG